MTVTGLGLGRRQHQFSQALHHVFRRRRAQEPFGPVTLDGAGMSDRTPFLGLGSSSTAEGGGGATGATGAAAGAMVAVSISQFLSKKEA